MSCCSRARSMPCYLSARRLQTCCLSVCYLCFFILSLTISCCQHYYYSSCILRVELRSSLRSSWWSRPNFPACAGYSSPFYLSRRCWTEAVGRTPSFKEQLRQISLWSQRSVGWHLRSHCLQLRALLVFCASNFHKRICWWLVLRFPSNYFGTSSWEHWICWGRVYCYKLLVLLNAPWARSTFLFAQSLVAASSSRSRPRPPGSILYSKYRRKHPSSRICKTRRPYL